MDLGPQSEDTDARPTFAIVAIVCAMLGFSLFLLSLDEPQQLARAAFETSLFVPLLLFSLRR